MSGAARTGSRGRRAEQGARGWALVACALVAAWISLSAEPAHAQLPVVVVEQVLPAGAGGLVSAPLGPKVKVVPMLIHSGWRPVAAGSV